MSFVVLTGLWRGGTPVTDHERAPAIAEFDRPACVAALGERPLSRRGVRIGSVSGTGGDSDDPDDDTSVQAVAATAMLTGRHATSSVHVVAPPYTASSSGRSGASLARGPPIQAAHKPSARVPAEHGWARLGLTSPACIDSPPSPTTPRSIWGRCSFIPRAPLTTTFIPDLAAADRALRPLHAIRNGIVARSGARDARGVAERSFRSHVAQLSHSFTKGGRT